jgi:hypothetical protein
MNSLFIYRIIKDLFNEKRKLINLILLLLNFLLKILNYIFKKCQKISLVEKLKMSESIKKKLDYFTI